MGLDIDRQEIGLGLRRVGVAVPRIVDEDLGVGLGFDQAGEIPVEAGFRPEQPFEIGLLGIPHIDDVVGAITEMLAKKGGDGVGIVMGGDARWEPVIAAIADDHRHRVGVFGRRRQGTIKLAHPHSRP